MYQEKSLVCRDCGAEFTFTASEQEFFASKGFINDPSRCPQCRAVRKQRQTQGGFSNGRPQRRIHQAVCARCGGVAEVPFEPTAGKPVYCRDCYTPRSRY